VRIVISGGTGLIGRALVEVLTAAGWEVVILTRQPASHRADLPGKVRLAEWDGRTVAGWLQWLEGAEAVINLAGENLAGEGLLPDRWTEPKKRRIRESRLDAGQAIVRAIAATAVKPKALIQASAVGYYGLTGDKIITEETGPGDDFLAQLCIEWEAVSSPVEAEGVRRVVIRTGLVLSREGGPLPKTVLPFKLFAGGRLGHGRQWWPWIHLEDHVQAIRFLLERSEATGAFNLTAPNPVTNAEFSETLGRVLKRPSWLPAPAFALRLALGEAATMVLDGQRAVPRRLLELGFDFRFPNLEEALRDLLESKNEQ
jgi:uncharacterized protein